MWIDITMPLHKNMPIWPGDTPFSYKQDATLTEDGANVGQITMSLHAGTHIDAPYHYDDFGKAIDALPLELFIGAVKIVDVVGVKCIQLAHVENLELHNVERLFFKTKVVQDLCHFDADFTTIAPEVIRFLANQGVRVVGTDAPSVDALDDVSLIAHHTCRQMGIYIIENLFLKDVDAGMYEFIALPLAIQGGDASPIRAVVRKMK
ncbi:arylformamidase [Lysinibacillus sp. KU-BSD001]|uniref:arylformamidase n=1 Tax=Lysinibacillus sp. KU-BSD001 TaxID=3141328 RepID=UPI0036ED1E38